MRVGLCLPISERGEDRRALSYAQIRELAVAAEEGGLDSLWVADHLFIRGGDGRDRGAWESWTMLAGLAEATNRVELGPLVLCTPFRNAGVITSMANSLEEVSGGRLVLGLGSGWHAPEFEAFGFDFDHRVGTFADQLEVIVPLLRDGRVEYEGRFARSEGTLRPPRHRRNGPPILIASSRPRMMSLTARWADRWNSVWYGLPTDEFREESDRLSAACAAIGRDPQTVERSAGIQVRDSADGGANSDESLGGTTERIGEGLAAWREEGVDEVMCRMEPPSVALVEAIAQAARSLAPQPA